MEEKNPKKLQLEEILNLEKNKTENPKKDAVDQADDIEKNIGQVDDVKENIETIDDIKEDVGQEYNIEKDIEKIDDIKKDVGQEYNIEKGVKEVDSIKEDVGREYSVEKGVEKIEEKQDIGLMEKRKDQRGELREEIEEEGKQKEEKVEFLKREDIKTMKKDIKEIREMEAGKESSKISLLGTKKDKLKKEGVAAVEKEEVAEHTPIMPKFSKETSSSNKILIRLAFIFVTILIGGGAYWFFSTQEKVVIVPPPVEEEVKVNVPEAFATIASTFSFNLEEKQKIIPAMELLDVENLTKDKLTRLIIKDSEKQLITLDNIEELFGIKFSAEILGKIDQENFNFLVLERGGEVEKSLIIKATAKISNPALAWEKLIEEELITIEEGEDEVSLFKDFQSENRNIRCLINSSEYQLTLCYTTINDYFIISESFDSIQPTIIGLNDVTRKRIGQLFIIGFEGTTVTSDLESFFEKYYPGGVLLLSKNILSSHQITKLNEELQSLSLETTNQPLLISVDQEGGTVSRVDFLKELTAQSEIKELNNAYQIGLKRGEELKELGINLNLSPLMDNAGEEDYLYSRSFQKDPELAGELGKSLILGHQEAEIFSAIKHFPGYIGMMTNPEERLMIASSEPVITQFKEVMKVSPAFVMTANAIYEKIDPSLPFTFSETAIDYLKDSLGRDVLILSDDLLQNSLLNSYDLKDIVINPINAGIDLEIISGYRSSVSEALDAFLNAVNNQEISLEKIDTAVSRIIKFKKEL